MATKQFSGTVMFVTVLLLAGAVTSARAQNPTPFTLNFDEHGNCSLSTQPACKGNLVADPSQSSRPLVLTYFLPAGVDEGDVIVTHSDGSRSDVIRFTDASGGLSGTLAADRMIYYSDADATVTDSDPADTGFPTNVGFGKTASTLETGSEGADGFRYTAPFFSGTNAYNGISDGVLPEPSSFLLFGTGLLTIGGYMRRKWLQ